MAILVQTAENLQMNISGCHENGFHSQETLNHWIESNANRIGDRAAIISAQGDISYRELYENVHKMARGLSGLGVRKGDIVAIQLPNCPEFVIGVLAICSIGAIVQMLHMPYQSKEIQYLLSDSNAVAVICLTSFKDYSPAGIMLDLVESGLRALHVVALGKDIPGTHNYAGLSDAGQRADADVPDARSPFVLLYTSGTTAKPKGVLHRYDSFLGNAATAAKELNITADDRVLSLAAMSHLYGLFTLNMTLSVGGAVVLLPAFSPSAFKEVLSQLAPTAVFAAPAHFIASTNDSFVDSDDLSCVNLVCLSGAHVPAELADRVDGMLGAGKVIQLWGMTELQAGTYGRPSTAKASRFETAGPPSPGTELRVVNADGEELGPNSEGELHVRGPSVFKEYMNKPDETEAAFSADGWFITGDLARVDENGCMSITGRVKEIINRGGVKYNPIEIEEPLQRMAQIDACAVVPIKDDVMGEIACLFAVVSEGQDLTLADVTDYLQSDGIAKYKWPERLETISAMPLTPTGKVMRGELKARVTS